MRSKTNNALYLSLNEEQFEPISNLLNELLLYEKLFDPISNVIRTNKCMIFIASLCEIYSNNQKKLIKKKISGDESFMKSISYIHENFHKKITIEDLCAIAHLSRSSYIRKFKDICKMPPSTYITQRRIDSAKNMLVNTHYSISEIAYRTGFYDTSHFTKTFEIETGISPASYRKNNSI